MKDSFKRLILSLGVAIVAALFLCSTSRAQQTVTITGSVTDSSGPVVPRATVTATNEETGTTQATVSNADGIYDIRGLSVGLYTIEVKAQGFTTYKKTGIVANAGMTLSENVRMEVGAVSQIVTVQAAALQVQTESNELSTLISGQQLRNIATNGRNITSLYTLGTGVSWNGPAFNGVTAQNSTATISFNGLRPDHNNFLIRPDRRYRRRKYSAAVPGWVDVTPAENVAPASRQAVVRASSPAPAQPRLPNQLAVS